MPRPFTARPDPTPQVPVHHVEREGVFRAYIGCMWGVYGVFRGVLGCICGVYRCTYGNKRRIKGKYKGYNIVR